MSVEYVSKSERQRAIKKVMDTSNVVTQVKFDKEVYECKTIEIDEKNLIYRANNTRLIGDIDIYSAKNNVSPQEYFSLDREENEEVQNLLHDFLKPYVGKLKETYQREGSLDALWIYPDGRVINGNRRLRFYRELGNQKINCAVLDDIYLLDKELEIEAELDVKEYDEVKYPWYGIGRNLALLEEEGLDYDQIGRKRSLTKRMVEQRITAFKGAEEYLKQSGNPGRWDLLSPKGEESKNEQLWMDYGRLYSPSVKNKTQEDKDMALFVTGVTSLVPTAEVGDRKYKYLKPLLTKTENLRQVIKKSVPESVSSVSSAFGDHDTFKIKDAINQIETRGISKLYAGIRDAQAQLAEESADVTRLKVLKKHISEANRDLAQAVAQCDKHNDLETNGLVNSIEEIELNIEKIKNYISEQTK